MVIRSFLQIVFSDQEGESAGRFHLQRRVGAWLLLFHGGAVLSAVFPVGKLLADLQNIRFALAAGKGIEHGVDVGKLPPCVFNLLAELALGGFFAVVILIISIGVDGRRKARIQPNRNAFTRFIVGSHEQNIALLDAIKLLKDEISRLAAFFRRGGIGQLLLLEGDLFL